MTMTMMKIMNQLQRSTHVLQWLPKSSSAITIVATTSARSASSVASVSSFYNEHHHQRRQRTFHAQQQQQQQHHHQRRTTFSFAGPRKLDEVIKKELLQSKTGTEIADLWLSYHETKESMLGMVLKGADGTTVLSRAAKCPFFVQPVFRDDGYFMLISQFQQPHHFLMAYLEDYKMDPSSATPLVTFSIFDDYVASKDVALTRIDILNQALEDAEGLKVVQCVVENYTNPALFEAVQTFNERPTDFDINDYISRMNHKWQTTDATTTPPPSSNAAAAPTTSSNKASYSTTTTNSSDTAGNRDC